MIGQHKKVNGDVHVKLLRIWLQTVQISDDMTERILSSLFKAQKSAIAGKISAACSGGGGIPSRDEDIFECYRRLMDRYSDLAKRFTETKHRITTAKAAAILTGIYSVVVSRLILFDENLIKTDSVRNMNLSQPRINPIFLEKKEILSECVKGFSKSFDATAYRFHYENQDAIIRAVREAFANGADYAGIVELINGFAAKMSEFCLMPFYKYYADFAGTAAVNLNDFEKRQVLSSYVDLLTQEKQIIEDISKTQIPVLNELLQAPKMSDDEKGVIFGVVYSLNEAGERFNDEMERVAALFKLTADDTKPNEYRIDDFDTFADEMSELISGEKHISIQAFDEAKQLFDVKLSHFLKVTETDVLGFINANLATSQANLYKYRFNKAVYEVALMADDMCLSFKNLHNYYTDNLSGNTIAEAGEMAIVKGIAETVSIKLETLTEAKDTFKSEVYALLDSFFAELQTFAPPNDDSYTESAEKAAFRLVLCLCAQSYEERNSLAGLKKILSDCLAGINGGYEDMLSKTIQKYDDAVNKKITAFKKEHLLYEMSTFEEILNYSVSRLRQSDNGKVSDFVVHIDKETENLISILQKNGIDVINPMPHDMFNGREHEVLLAESNKEFKKGEIIKLMNNGYKQGETVLIRANVIAAK